MIKATAPMAGITNAEFLNKIIPYGFNLATLGGYSLDEKTIQATEQILKRGRKEFNIKKEKIINHIENEVKILKQNHKNIKVSANVRSTTPQPIINVGNIKNLDIVEINCHCRQNEILKIGCGQKMLNSPDLENFISTVTDNVKSQVSVKIRANIPQINTFEVIQLIEDAGADYVHIDAMKKGVQEADWKLLKEISSKYKIKIIGNNSINSQDNLSKMISTGVDGFSIARAILSGKLDFKI